MPSSFHPHLNVSPAAAAEIMHRNRKRTPAELAVKALIDSKMRPNTINAIMGGPLYSCPNCGGTHSHYPTCTL